MILRVGFASEVLIPWRRVLDIWGGRNEINRDWDRRRGESVFRVSVNEEAVHLLDGGGELVMWDRAEWVEDPGVVPAIVNAIRIGYEQGVGAVRAALPITSAPARGSDLERVEFTWSTRYGRCYGCGLPAAYLNDVNQTLCCVCAASEAADGGEIRRIDND